MSTLHEKTKYDVAGVHKNVVGQMKIKPVSVLVVLHDPSQPANMRTKSITIPLGQSSTVYITPSATETDTSGQMLGETQRECRLKQENENLQVFREVLINSKTNKIKQITMFFSFFSSGNILERLVSLSVKWNKLFKGVDVIHGIILSKTRTMT